MHSPVKTGSDRRFITDSVLTVRRATLPVSVGLHVGLSLLLLHRRRLWMVRQTCCWSYYASVLALCWCLWLCSLLSCGGGGGGGECIVSPMQLQLWNGYYITRLVRASAMFTAPYIIARGFVPPLAVCGGDIRHQTNGLCVSVSLLCSASLSGTLNTSTALYCITV